MAISADARMTDRIYAGALVEAPLKEVVEMLRQAQRRHDGARNSHRGRRPAALLLASAAAASATGHRLLVAGGTLVKG